MIAIDEEKFWERLSHGNLECVEQDGHSIKKALEASQSKVEGLEAIINDMGTLYRVEGCHSDIELGDIYDDTYAMCIRLRQAAQIGASSRDGEVDALKEMLQELLDCPHSVDSATVPPNGKTFASDRLVLQYSISHSRYLKARNLVERSQP